MYDYLAHHPRFLLSLLHKLAHPTCYFYENIAILKLFSEFADEDKGNKLL